MWDIEKWYMRILLALSGGFLWFHLLMSVIINLFVREEGFLTYQFVPFGYIYRYLDSYNIHYDVFSALLGGFFLITVIGSLSRPRIFIWPVVAVNLFIFVGSIDLIWLNYKRPFLPAHTPYGTVDNYVWVEAREVLIFFSALFVILLMPAVFHLIKKTKWYNHVSAIWKRR